MISRSLFRMSCLLMTGVLYTGCAMAGDDMTDRQVTAELGAAESPGAFVLTLNTASLGNIAVTSSDGTPRRVCAGSNCRFAYLAGADLVLTVVTPNDRANCIVFTGWSGACQGRGNPCPLVLDGDLAAAATWASIPRCNPI